MEIPPQPDQNIEQSIPTLPIRHEIDQAEIPQLEEDPEEEQPQDLQTYLTHHNTYKESQHICRDYRAMLLELDNDRYYARNRQSVSDLWTTPSTGLYTSKPGPRSLLNDPRTYANIW